MRATFGINDRTGSVRNTGNTTYYGRFNSNLHGLNNKLSLEFNLSAITVNPSQVPMFGQALPFIIQHIHLKEIQKLVYGTLTTMFHQWLYIQEK